MIAISELRQILRYEPETGKLYWLARNAEMIEAKKYPAERESSRWNSRYAGKEAFAKKGTGYVAGRILGSRQYKAHRVAWALHYGEWPEGQIDHINGIRDDNRIANLRIVTPSENSKNCKKRSNGSNVFGVSQTNSNKWAVKIGHEGRQYFLGVYENFELAVAVRKDAEARLGFHPNHGRAQ